MLIKKHNQEWLDSAVDQSLIDLNVVSLEGLEAYDRLLYGIPNSDRTNIGILRNKLLKRYAHLDKGGWWVSGKDLLTGEDSLWGNFKPNTPYQYQEIPKKGFGPQPKAKTTIIKYETPKGVATEIIALGVTFFHSWKIIENRDENSKNAWITRFEKILHSGNGNISQTQKRVGKFTPHNRSSLQQRQSSQTDRRGYRDPHFPQCLGELQTACERREYGEIDRIFQSVWHRLQNSPKQPGTTNSTGIERLIQTEDQEFWPWLIENPQIPITITEGAKKAGALISAGHAAIAQPGIFNGYRQPKDELGRKIGKAKLIPQLQVLATGEREINFCFDNDSKPATVKNVRIAIARTGTLLKLQGCKVSVVSWTGAEKGVDDLIVSRGVEYYNILYRARVSLTSFKQLNILDIAKYNPLVVNQRYLEEDLLPPAETQLIGFKSPKDTGKTEHLSRIVRRLINKGKPVLIITHRIQLAKALCDRLGVDHIEEVRTSPTRGILGYGLCIDSLHSKSQARFDPEDWSEAVIILDEAEQVLWHMLDSDTCQKNRVEIIENFQALLKTVVSTGGQIYLSDADLSAIALDYVIELIGSEIKTWVAENRYQPKTKRKLISYTGHDPRKLIAALIKAIERGERVLIHTTGQKAKSKWGSTNLERLLREKFPFKQILRIDRDTVAEPGHPAFGCIANLDQVLSCYDIAIASPVIETGVSINLKGHFGSVWAIAQGVQTVDAVCQAVERSRDNIPRHIWIKTTAKGNRIGNGSTSVKALLRSQDKLTKANIFLLQQASINDFDDVDFNFSLESFKAWAKRACIVNAGKNDYRDSVLSKLVSEGYELEKYRQDDIENADDIKQEVYETCKNNYQNYRQKVSDADEITELELKKLKNKKSKTEAERLSQQKAHLTQKYGIKVTPEVIEKDDKGWHSKLTLLYYLTVGNRFLAERDRQRLSKLSEQNDKAFKPDVNKNALSAQIKALKIIGIEQFLNPDADFSKSQLTEFHERAVLMALDIKTILGVSIHTTKDSAIAIAQRILAKLGHKMEFIGTRGNRSNKERTYSGCSIDDQTSEIFQYWLSREKPEVGSEESSAA